MRCLALFLAALPFAASAGVEEVVADHILPGHAAFADSTEVLAATADTACTGPEIESGLSGCVRCVDRGFPHPVRADRG